MASYYTYGEIPFGLGGEYDFGGGLPDYQPESYASPLASAGAPDINQIASAYSGMRLLPDLTSPGAGLANATPQMQTLSNLLQQNRFSEAYQYAAENNLRNMLTDVYQLKNLRSPFSREEAAQFIGAMPPDFLQKAYDLTPEQFAKMYVYDPSVAGITERGGLAWLGAPSGVPGEVNMMESGYPLLERSLVPIEQRSEKGAWMEPLVKAALALGTAYAGGSLLGGLGGAPAATAAPAAGATGFTPGLAASQMAASGLAGGSAAAAATAAELLPVITVTASKLGLTIPEAAALVAGGAATSGALGSGATATPLEEIVVTASPTAQGSLATAIPALAATQAVQAAQPTIPQAEVVPPTGELPLEEIVVSASPIAKGSLAGLAALAPLTAAQVAQMGTPVEQIIEGLPDPTKIKLTPGEMFASIVDKVGGAANALQIMGALAALTAGGGGGGAGGRGAGGAAGFGGAPGAFGGALPKYQFQRTQLQPQVDYYRYGMGPEAKFFEDKMVEVAPPPPPPAEPSGMVNPKDIPIFAGGGLAGYAKGGSSKPRYVEGPGSGRDDKIPALLSDGEYVIDAETLALLGDGSTKEGARRMDKFRASIRQHKGRALSRGRISPDAKSPSKYMGGGLT